MITESDVEFMRAALALAQNAYAMGEVPVGAVIVHDEKIIGEGWNQPIAQHDPTAHAEIMAIRQAALFQKNYRLPQTTLYVTIEPCTMCLGAMIHARITRLVFGAVEPKAGVLASHSLVTANDIFNHQIVWQGGVLEPECSALMQRFFRERRDAKKAEKKAREQ